MADEIWKSASHSGGSLPQDYVNHKYKVDQPLRINFSLEMRPDGSNYDIAVVEFGKAVDINLIKGMSDMYYPERLFPVVSIAACIQTRLTRDRPWTCQFNLGDFGHDPDIPSFCSNAPGALLMPDDSFCMSQGHLALSRLFGAARPWEARIDRAYFRGTDTGVFRYPFEERPYRAPRVALARLSRVHPDYLDIALTNVEAGRQDAEQSRQLYEHLGIMGPQDPQDRLLDFKYQVDIDGNSNSWNGLFLKLLTGSPVIKVQSEFGFRQWYYDQLRPWENFAPVGPDFESILTVIDRLRAKPRLARNIGRRGRQLALSLTFDSQIFKVAKKIYQRLANR